MYGKPLRLLMGMVGLVLLIAVTNVVMLLMARNATRQREFSMKLALGAGRGDLLRQLLTESLLLVVSGRAAGLGLRAVCHQGAWLLGANRIQPRAGRQRFCALRWAFWRLPCLLFGLAPLRIALSAGPSLALKTSAATSGADAGKVAHGQNHRRAADDACVSFCWSRAGLLIRTLQQSRKHSAWDEGRWAWSFSA